MTNIFIGVELWAFIFAAILSLFLGFLTWRNNPRSATNRLFGILGLVVAAWIAANYLSLHPWDADLAKLIIRSTFFLAIPMNICFFLLAHTLPSAVLRMHKGIHSCLWGIGALVMAGVIVPTALGVGSVAENAGMAAFGFLSIGLNVGAVIILIRRYRQSEGAEQQQLLLVMLGTLLMFGLIISTVFLPFAALGVDFFVPFFPMYTLIFLGFTTYAIVRHHLFNLKVIAAEAFVFLLGLLLFAKIFVVANTSEMIASAAVFLASMTVGLLLIRSVRREVEQRVLLEDVTAQLQQANTKLDAANRMKTRLLSIASHQIKSPIALIRGYASNLVEGLYGPMDGKVKSILTKMRDSAGDLALLIDDFLDLRKLEEGEIQYHFGTVDLNAMLGSVAEGQRDPARFKGLELKVKLPPQQIFVSGDLRKLHEVFQNLLDNAIKYTDQGSIGISAVARGGEAVVSVEDTGMGISTDLQEHLFEEFERDEKVRDIVGTGVGLYVAKTIVTAHNGRIWAESEGEGKGSKFMVALPLLK